MVMLIALIAFIFLEQKTYVKIKFLRSCSAIRKGFNQYMKSDKMPYIIYENIKSLIKK